ncbi:MAG: glycosyltransferase family 4 protein [Polyangiaceae bacterium]|nr:glycosyltransferase family 4 protein [Polyangiaceae bacterium]
MRIAIISTPFVRVPPHGYGGTELFCYELAEGLTWRGHDVTLFATGDSVVTCRRRALFAAPQWPPYVEDDVNHVSWAFSEIARDERFDVVQLNSPVGVTFAHTCRAPVVHTLHHARVEAISRLYARHPEISYVAISESQLSIEVPLRDARVIYHGLSPGRYPQSLRDEGYLLHLGRYAPEKGTHLAIDIARAAGLPIRMAGRAHPADLRYFEEEVAPRLAQPGVQDLGEAGPEAKLALLRGARALVCPLRWEEPFGLIAVEAMLCGTPVLGFRRGAFPEIVDEGVTGHLADDGDADALARIARGLAGFDRAACARRARERFSANSMVAQYEALYQDLVGPRQAEQPRAA